MATERDLASDSDDTFVTKLATRHLDYLRSRLIQCLSDAKDFSADIIHIPGQPAHMTVSFDSKKGYHEQHNSSSNKISVRNLPPNSDQDHLRMFFEYEKGQGGGAVRHTTLDDENHFAIVEFEETKAVDAVLSKRPIKMLGRTVDVEAYRPYLEYDEPLKSVELTELPQALVEEIAELTLKDLKENSALGEATAVRDFTDSVGAIPRQKGIECHSQVAGETEEAARGPLSIRLASIARECTVVRENGIVLYDTSSGLIPVAQLIACRPLTRENNTFSIRILRTGQERTMSLGLVPLDYQEDSQPGWGPNSVGYHADDGGIFIGNGYPTFEIERAHEGDIMFMQADIDRKKIFFGRNGIKYKTLDFDSSGVYPCIGMHSLGEAVQIMEKDFWKAYSAPIDLIIPPSFQTAKNDDLWISPSDRVVMRKIDGDYMGWLTLYNPSQESVAFQVRFGSKEGVFDIVRQAFNESHLRRKTIYGSLGYKDVWLELLEEEKLGRFHEVSVAWTIFDSESKEKISRLFSKQPNKPEAGRSCKLSVKWE